jgi:hypothetical protein
VFHDHTNSPKSSWHHLDPISCLPNLVDLVHSILIQIEHLSKVCYDPNNIIFSESCGVGTLHTTYPYSMLSNKPFEPHSQISSIHIQPHAHLILLTKCTLFKFKLSIWVSCTIFYLFCPLTLVVLRYITPWLKFLEPFKPIIIFDPPSHPKLVWILQRRI